MYNLFFFVTDVCPDMVIIGKPMANGHPISGVMTKWKYVSKFFEKNGHHLMSQVRYWISE